MPNINQTHRAFGGFISRQKATVETINTEMRETRAQLKSTDNELAAAIEQTFPDLQTFPANDLTQIARTSGLDVNFSELLLKMRRDNAVLAKDYQDLVHAHGTPEHIADELKKTGNALSPLQDSAAKMSKEVSAYDTALSKFQDYLGEKTKKIDEKAVKNAVDYYSALSFGRFFNGDWWRGNGIVKGYKPVGEGLLTDWKSRETTKAKLAITNADVTGKEGYKAELVFARDKMAKTQNGILPDAGILGVLHKKVRDSLFNDTFINALGGYLGKESVAPLAGAVLKIKNVEKIERNLTAIMTAAKDVLKKLEAPMSKLSRGASAAGYTNIKIDLDGIDKAVTGQEQYAQKLTGNTREVREGIRNFNFDVPDIRVPASDSFNGSSNGLSSPHSPVDDSTMNMMNWMNTLMLLNLINSMNEDNHYVHHALGQGVDFGNVNVPTVDQTSIDTGTAGLQDIANQTFATPDMVVPDLTVPAIPDMTIPDMAIPDINVAVPDIVMPDINFSVPDSPPSFDAGN